MDFLKRVALVNAMMGQLEEHEGFKKWPYKDTEGVITIGHGLTYLTEKESRMIVRYRLATEYLPHLIRLFPSLSTLSYNRQSVLLNMMYALGPTKFSKFVNLRAAVSRSDFKAAGDEILDSVWAGQVHGRADELAKMMRAG